MNRTTKSEDAPMLESWLRRAGARAKFFLVSNNIMDEINQETIRLGGRPRCFIATKEAWTIWVSAWAGRRSCGDGPPSPAVCHGDF